MNPVTDSSTIYQGPEGPVARDGTSLCVYIRLTSRYDHIPALDYHRLCSIQFTRLLVNPVAPIRLHLYLLGIWCWGVVHCRHDDTRLVYMLW